MLVIGNPPHHVHSFPSTSWSVRLLLQYKKGSGVTTSMGMSNSYLFDSMCISVPVLAVSLDLVRADGIEWTSLYRSSIGTDIGCDDCIGDGDGGGGFGDASRVEVGKGPQLILNGGCDLLAELLTIYYGDSGKI